MIKRLFVLHVVQVLLFSRKTVVGETLVANEPEKPQILSDKSDVCSASQGRTDDCEVELDVPAVCVNDGESECPVVFFLHGAGGNNNGFARQSGVHDAGFIGVYPQGENKGWSTGPKNTDSCDWDDFDCTDDPNEGEFFANIIAELRKLGANGNVYLIGNSNGAALAHRLAANADDNGSLPIAGIVTKVTQLLDTPERSGPGTLNYNQPSSKSDQVSVLNLMGTMDGLIPYKGGTSSVFGGNDNFKLMSALDSMEKWADHNGCDKEPKKTEGLSTDNKYNGAILYEYLNCDDGKIVEHYAVIEGDHSAGGVTIDGKKMDYEIAFDFINRNEDNDVLIPTVSPNDAPTPSSEDILVWNPPEIPQILSDMSDVCSASQGRTDKCEVELDVPSTCVNDGGESECPIVFFLHGAGGTNDWFAKQSGVHDAGFIGVYPQGENGWNTGPKSTNSCDWTDYDCTDDPDEGEFIAKIIAELRELGANGNVYVIGNSNGAALAHRLAANADKGKGSLPIAGIVTKVTQLLDTPERSGPGTLNYNQPSTKSDQVSVLNLMGTADGLIPYKGGTSGVFGGNDDFKLMSALDSMEKWADHNGCDKEPKKTEGLSTDNKYNGAVLYEYLNCDDGKIVEHYAVIEGDHSAGGVTIDGRKMDYEIAFDFINRNEGNDDVSTPTASPNEAPTSSSEDDTPTLAPTSSPDDDDDDSPPTGDFQEFLTEFLLAVLDLLFEFVPILAELLGVDDE